MTYDSELVSDFRKLVELIGKDTSKTILLPYIQSEFAELKRNMNTQLDIMEKQTLRIVQSDVQKTRSTIQETTNQFNYYKDIIKELRNENKEFITKTRDYLENVDINQRAQDLIAETEKIEEVLIKTDEQINFFQNYASGFMERNANTLDALNKKMPDISESINRFDQTLAKVNKNISCNETLFIEETKKIENATEATYKLLPSLEKKIQTFIIALEENFKRNNAHFKSIEANKFELKNSIEDQKQVFEKRLVEVERSIVDLTSMVSRIEQNHAKSMSVKAGAIFDHLKKNI